MHMLIRLDWLRVQKLFGNRSVVTVTFFGEVIVLWQYLTVPHNGMTCCRVELGQESIDAALIT
jgi:hypothetical protein